MVVEITTLEHVIGQFWGYGVGMCSEVVTQ